MRIAGDIKICSLDEIGRENWDSYAEKNGGSVFHHSSWHRTIELTYGFETAYLIKEDASGAIIGGMPAAFIKGAYGSPRLVSFPFSDACGPISGSANGAASVVGAAISLVGGGAVASAEIRLYSPCSKEKTGCEYANFTLELDREPDEIIGTFHRDCVQRQIKKAFKTGLEVREDSSPSGLKDFYGLHLMTRKRQGSPVQPFRFFKNLLKELGKYGMVSVLLVKKEGRPVSGIVLLRSGKTAYYKFGASDENHAPPGANQLALWTAIKKAYHDGCKKFDFGRTYTGNKGLMDYKSRWGARYSNLEYIRVPERHGLNCEGGLSGRVASVVFRNIPVFSNRILGSLLYKYLA